MAILLFFAFLAGIATVLSPCVIPVLPALLSASGGQGRARPFGIILGLVVSFVFFTLTLTALVKATGVSPNILRSIAIGLIALFGLFMMFPSLGDWFAKITSGVANLGQKVQEQSKKAGKGFWSGFLLGTALGLVWTPCAGPILAAITTLVATSAVSWSAFFITLAYSLGTAIPMFLIIWGGQKAIQSSRFLSQHAESIRKAFGGLMVLAALMLAFHVEVYLQQLAVKYFPMVTVEDRPIVRQELKKLQAPSVFGESISRGEKIKAPDFVDISSWINSKPLSIEQLKGKVVLVDFWTYSCINCIRTFPYLTRWYHDYKDKGFVIVGVHTPEFAFEKDKTNVEEATQRFKIEYPVALDNDYATWQAYANHYWPAHYLIDQNGVVQEAHFGEGNYLETENAIRHLLGLEALANTKEMPVNRRMISPETYLGTERAILHNPNVQLSGEWKHEEEKIVAADDGASLTLHFLATRVYLVLGGKSDKPISIFLDGQPLPKEFYTKDLSSDGELFVKESRKYDIVDLQDQYGLHTLTLHFPKGIEAYAFTFGDEPESK